MTAKPEQEMQNICNHLGLPFESEMLHIYQKNEKKRRMTDGINEESKMLGDVKFHTHKGIDSSAANRWKKQFDFDMLHTETQAVAHNLGYLEDVSTSATSATSATSGTSTSDKSFSESTGTSATSGTSASEYTSDSMPQNDTSAGTDKPNSSDLTIRYPLSYAQKRLWFFDRLETGNNVYNMPISLRINGALNYLAMEKAMHSLTQKHSILRSRYGLENSDPYYTVSPKSLTLSLVNVSVLQGA